MQQGGSKKGIITRVMIGYTGNSSRDVGRIEHAPQTVPVGGNSTFVLATISNFRLAQGGTVQSSY